MHTSCKQDNQRRDKFLFSPEGRTKNRTNFCFTADTVGLKTQTLHTFGFKITATPQGEIYSPKFRTQKKSNKTADSNACLNDCSELIIATYPYATNTISET